jgi:hypothetical protein
MEQRMYPHKEYTRKFIAERFSPEERKRVEDIRRAQEKRISQIKDETFLNIEMGEGEQKWNFARDIIEGRSQPAYLDAESAKWELVYAYYRYWMAFETLKRVRHGRSLTQRWQFWLVVIGGLIVAVLGTIYTILAYYKPGH